MIEKVKKMEVIEGINRKEEQNKKRGRRPNNYKEEYKLKRDRTKFIIDLSKNKNSLQSVFKLLTDANKKNYGSEITFKELAIYALAKLNQKDIEKIQEQTMSEMEKVERTLNEYNQKNGTKLSLGEFLVKKLNIN